jgi:hypothetical protein
MRIGNDSLYPIILVKVIKQSEGVYGWSLHIDRIDFRLVEYFFVCGSSLANQFYSVGGGRERKRPRSQLPGVT